jgi:hypothetical protein
MPDKSEDFEDRKIEISNYFRTLKALICFKKLIEERLGGAFYFGGVLTYQSPDSRQAQTPDIVATLPDSVWVGEVKKSLPKPRDIEMPDGSMKNLIEKDIMEHLKKYDEPFEELHVDSHDVILFAPERDNEALGFIKFDYLRTKEQNGQRVFDNNFAIIVYSIEPGANNNIEYIRIRLDYGTLTNITAVDLLQRAYQRTVKELNEDLGKYKVFEEAHITPPEYVMSVLWTDVFPEIAQKSSIERINEWKRTREHIFEVSTEDLLSHLHGLYTLPSYNNENRKQFNRKVVFEAMALFEKVTSYCKKTGKNEPLVRKVKRGAVTCYRVWYRHLPRKDELDYFLRAIYKTEQRPSASLAKQDDQQKLSQWQEP